MKLNLSKCKELIFNFFKEKQTFIPLNIGVELVEKVPSVGILGLIFGDDLRCNKHINNSEEGRKEALYAKNTKTFKCKCVYFDDCIYDNDKSCP